MTPMSEMMFGCMPAFNWRRIDTSRCTMRAYACFTRESAGRTSRFIATLACRTLSYRPSTSPYWPARTHDHTALHDQTVQLAQVSPTAA
ncbi:MAG: hypothetical protein ACK56F_12755 [bacterium]